MTPFPTQQEIMEFQRNARIAWDKAQQCEGLEKMRYINEAFPYAVQGGIGSLRFSWHHSAGAIAVADAHGFLTIIERDDIVTMLIAIGMDAARPGAFRELVEGKKRREQSKAHEERVVRTRDEMAERRARNPLLKGPKPKSSSLTLDDIGLGKKEAPNDDELSTSSKADRGEV